MFEIDSTVYAIIEYYSLLILLKQTFMVSITREYMYHIYRAIKSQVYKHPILPVDKFPNEIVLVI